jgi:ArsR family transcriptional regulator
MKQKYCSNKKLSIRFIDLERFLRVIGEDNRLKIIYLLKDGERCVCEIWQNLDLPQNLISSHLKILKDFGLIRSRKEGKRIYYVINLNIFLKYKSLLINFLRNYAK